jgi:F-type H+-transporting ATPase subunit delta
MAELATIARPYAEALFKAQASDLAGTAAWLDELAAIADNAQLQQFIDSPKVSDEQAFELISGVVRTALPEAGKNFLRLVIENRRLSALPVVAQQYRALMNALMRWSTAHSPSTLRLWPTCRPRSKNALRASSM